MRFFKIAKNISRITITLSRDISSTTTVEQVVFSKVLLAQNGDNKQVGNWSFNFKQVLPSIDKEDTRP